MRNCSTRWLLTITVMILGLSAGVPTQGAAQSKELKQAEETQIRSALETQVGAWNRGDIPGFMEYYENSPETTFVGTTSINKGFQPILERYKKGYANKDQMGKLTFSELDVRLLPASTGTMEYAVVTGHFHLERTAKGSATKDDGIFSLVWHKGPGGWKILLDHTS